VTSFVEPTTLRPFFVAFYSKVVFSHVASERCGILVMNEAGYVVVVSCLGVDSKLFEFFFDDAVERGVDVVFRKETVRIAFEGDLKLVDNLFR